MTPHIHPGTDTTINPVIINDTHRSKPMNKTKIIFIDAELDILAHALVCFDIGNHLIGADKWWDDEETLWILQKICWYGDIR